MTTAEIVSLIKDVGVPVAMLLWFALRVEKRLEALAAGQLAQTEALTKVAKSLEQVDDHFERSGPHRVLPAQPSTDRPPTDPRSDR